MPPAAREQIVVMRPKKVVAHGHHGGAWKVAFADFMTAMFALFLVLWLVNQSEDVRASISSYFKDPVAWSDQAGRSLLHGGSNRLTNERAADLEGERTRREQLRSAGDAIRGRLQRSLRLSKLADRVRIDLTAEGLRISLQDDPASGFFPPGSAAPSEEAAGVLALIGEELTSVQGRIVVEGHTDSTPYRASSGYSNWELSSDRAHSARRLLTTAGVPEERVVQVRGFADRDLLLPATPESPRNRRVTITLLADAHTSTPPATAPLAPPAPTPDAVLAPHSPPPPEASAKTPAPHHP